MVTINLDTDNLSSDDLVSTYFSLREENYGVVRIDKCSQVDKQYANIEVIHSSMFPGSEDQAALSLVESVRTELVEMSVITGTPMTGESLHLENLTLGPT